MTTAQRPAEPLAAATVNLALVISRCAVVAPRTVAIDAIGEAFTSAIALPGDADYPLTAAALDASRLVARVTTAPDGLEEPAEPLPAAWVFPAGDARAARFAAMTGGGRAPGRSDANPVTATLAVAIVFADNGDPDRALRVYALGAEAIRRIDRERSTLGVASLASAMDAPVPSFDPTARTHWTLSACAIAHPGDRVGDESYQRGVVSVFNEDATFDNASVSVAAGVVSLLTDRLPASPVIDTVNTDGLSLAALAAAIEAVGAGWRASINHAADSARPARELLDMTDTPALGAASPAALLYPTVL